MAIHRADVFPAHFLENRAGLLGREVVGEAMAQARRHALGWAADTLNHGLYALRSVLQIGPRAQARKVLRHRAHIRRDAHAVVVQYDRHVILELAAVVQRFPAHAAANRRITRNRHHPFIGSGLVASHRKSNGRRDCRPRVACAKHVMNILLALQETAQPLVLSKRFESRQSPGQKLMRIGLMPRIPHHFVGRNRVSGVQSDRQFDRTEVAA